MSSRKTKAVKPAASADHKYTPAQCAELIASPAVASAAVSEVIGKNMFPDLNINELITEVHDSIEAVQSGNMSGMEAMLVGQAKALQTVFVSLVRRSQAQEYLKQYSVYMGLALRAQAQCRATLQALVELKYPRQVVITGQANIAHGPQQVNNGSGSLAGENQNEQTKLLSGEPHATLDGRGTAAASGTHQAMETVAAVHRPQNARG